MKCISIALIVAFLLMASCGGGRTIAAPSLEAMHTELGQNNPYGMVPGLTLGTITLAECTKSDGSPLDYTATYSMTNLPTWLAFDAATRAVTLATGTTVPTEANEAAEVTFTCTDASDSTVNEALTFTINDLDGGGVVDGKEYENGAVPLVNSNGSFTLNPGNVGLYRLPSTPFRIPTGIVKPTAGMNPHDASDDTADFDGDTQTNLKEIADGTNLFVHETTGQFGTVDTYPLTIGPFGITFADFNNDGKLDIAVTKSATGKASVMLGNGDGTLGADTDFGVGTSPWGIVAADFNGDGNMDLAAVNNIDASISVLLGDGHGGFGTKTDYTTGFSPTFVTAADLNNDGNVDLAVTNSASSTVSIPLGNGDGTFAAKTDYTTGAAPQSITVADFNGDGNIDLAVANSAPGINTFSVLLGKGDGTFNAKTDYPTGTQPTSIVSADFNGDSILDIAVTTNANTIAINLGLGGGSFGTKTEFATGNSPRYMVAADLNGDKKVDLATSNTGAGSFSVSVLLSVGDGSFSAKTDYATPTQPVYLTACDLNADGAIDLAVAIGGGNVGVLLNQL